MGHEDQGVTGEPKFLKVLSESVLMGKGKFSLAPNLPRSPACPKSPLHSLGALPIVIFFSHLAPIRQYCCNILQRNHVIAILQRLRTAKYNAARFEVSSSPAVCGAFSSKPTKPRPSSAPLAVSAGSRRFGVRQEQLGEEVEDPLPQVPSVADAAQLQGALRRRRLPPCGNAPG